MAVRAGAAGAVAAAVAVPLLRRRLRIPAPVTVAACAAGPLAIAVLRPRSRKRDVALFAMQMWAFTMVHELPYDDPERLRAPPAQPLPDRRSTARSASAACPTSACSGRSPACAGVGTARPRPHLGRTGSGSSSPTSPWLCILLRHPERFPRAARQLAAVFDLGCVVYFAVPTAPPWWASEQGLTGEEVRRIMVEVGEETWGSAWPAMYDALGGNPWAAMPSLHFATSADGGDLARRGGTRSRARSAGPTR